MRPRLLLPLALLACTHSPRGPAVEECTLTTQLVPGIPGSPGHLIASDINPNGASELATLMRQMLADARVSREAALKGEAPPPMFARQRKLRCSWPTAPADRNSQFDTLAVAYLAQVQAIDERRIDARAAHENLISACRACHDTSCPGPIELIEPLHLPK